MSYYQVYYLVGACVQVYDPDVNGLVTATVVSIDTYTDRPLKYWLEFEGAIWLDYKYDGKHWSRY